MFFSQYRIFPAAALGLSFCLACSQKPEPQTAAQVQSAPHEELVVLQEAAVEPGPSPSEIKAVVDQNGPQLRQCYLVGTFKNSQLAGTVNVVFTIEPTGKVSTASDSGSNIPDPEVVTCVLDVFAKLEFRPGGTSATEVTYPISFGSQG